MSVWSAEEWRVKRGRKMSSDVFGTREERLAFIRRPVIRRHTTGGILIPNKEAKKKKKTWLNCFYYRKCSQQRRRLQHGGRNSQPFAPTASVYFPLKLTQPGGKNGFRTKATVSASTRGCCPVYQRPRLMSKRQIGSLC